MLQTIAIFCGFYKPFKGLISPGMAASYDNAHDVCKRKNIWMVQYLRERRTPNKKLNGYFRAKYFEEVSNK